MLFSRKDPPPPPVKSWGFEGKRFQRWFAITWLYVETVAFVGGLQSRTRADSLPPQLPKSGKIGLAWAKQIRANKEWYW